MLVTWGMVNLHNVYFKKFPLQNLNILEKIVASQSQLQFMTWNVCLIPHGGGWRGGIIVKLDVWGNVRHKKRICIKWSKSVLILKILFNFNS